MKRTIDKQIEEMRKRIDALSDNMDVSEENLRAINILTVKLANLKKQKSPYQVKAISYHYELGLSTKEINLTEQYG